MSKRWPQRAYIDLFAGPGLCLLRGKTPRVEDGSPLIALRLKKPFSHYVFVDDDQGHINALESRSATFGLTSAVKTLPGDCNDDEVIRQLLDFVPKHALCLLFADPFKWNLKFTTLQKIVTARRTDILVVVQIGNMKRAIPAAAQSITVAQSISEFFGDNGEWQSKYESARRRERTRALLDYYKQRLSTLGYLNEQYPREVAITNTRNVPLYYLVFATKHPLGLHMWQQATQKTAEGKQYLPGF